LRAELRRGYVAAAAITVSVVLPMLCAVGYAISSTADFSLFNSGWNGTSKLAKAVYESGRLMPTFELEYTGSDIAVAMLGLDKLRLEPHTGALVIIGPSLPFSESEGDLVREFVTDGGVLLLADDFGTGNSLLAAMGASSRFSNKLVMDLAFDKRPEFSICFDFENDTITRNITAVLLNYPSSVIPGKTNTRIIAWTSIASWLDTDGDHRYTTGESWGPFPLIVRERFGKGEIILVADPSILINGMRDKLDNAALSANLIMEISRLRTEVYFDESHREYFDPVKISTSVSGSIPAEVKIAFVLLALVLFIWLSTDYIDKAILWAWRKSKFLIARMWSKLTGKKPLEERHAEIDIEAIAKQLIEAHPDWKLGLIRYALREKLRHSEFISKRRAGE